MGLQQSNSGHFVFSFSGLVPLASRQFCSCKCMLRVHACQCITVPFLSQVSFRSALVTGRSHSSLVVVGPRCKQQALFKGAYQSVQQHRLESLYRQPCDTAQRGSSVLHRTALRGSSICSSGGRLIASAQIWAGSIVGDVAEFYWERRSRQGIDIGESFAAFQRH